MDYTGNSSHQLMVHKKDAEGVLLIDRLTGHVITGQTDRPEWSEGLVLAQLAERHLWYTNRLGPAYTDDLKAPEMLAFEDLGWCKMVPSGEDGTELVEDYHDADAEFRMEVLGSILGVDLTAETEEEAFANLKGVLVSVEIARDDSRTTGELEELRAAQAGRFEAIGEHDTDRKTGTAG